MLGFSLAYERKVRLEKLVDKLVAVKADSYLGEEQREEVVSVLREEARSNGFTRADFTVLDEKPGLFGYREDEGGWHWKLQQTRNRSRELFKGLNVA